MSNFWQQTKEKLGIFGSDHEQHEVNGTVHNFYPVTGRIIGRIKMFRKPLTKLAAAFSSKGTDVAIVSKVDTAGDSYKEEKAQQAISPELADKRYSQMHDAIDSLMELLTEVEFRNVISNIIMDSMRDLFPRTEKGKPGAGWPTDQEFFDEMPVTLLPGLLMGVLKANRKLFGPFAGVAESLMVKVKEAAEDPDAMAENLINKMRQLDPTQPDPTPTTTDAPGSDSKSSTSGSPDEDPTET